MKPFEEQDITEKLRIRADIRRTAKGRKSVEEGKPDRLAVLLDEAANEIDRLRANEHRYQDYREGREDLADSRAIEIENLENEGETLLEMVRVGAKEVERLNDKCAAQLEQIDRQERKIFDMQFRIEDIARKFRLELRAAVADITEENERLRADIEQMHTDAAGPDL
jgi:hypothetical protein